MELQRTTDAFTMGIVNLPILKDNGHAIMVEGKEGKLVPKTDVSKRFLFFELDDDDAFKMYNPHTPFVDAFNHVKDTYVNANLPVWIHKTMRGFHFFSLEPLEKDRYYLLMKQIKHLNPKCPMVTIRIKPNKWIGERKIWSQGSIIAKDFNKPLADLREWMQREYYDKIKANYRVVTYRQAGARGDL